MSNSTIWNEQICTGFLEALQQNVKVRGRSGTLEPVQNVVVMKPEIGFDKDLLPAITIRNYDVRRAVVNQMGKLPTYENYNTENGTVEYTKQPLKFWLYYQIDFWAEYQEDIDNMLISWISVMPDKGGALKVRNFDNEEVTTPCSLITMTALDGTDTDKRLFRRCLSYRVSALIDGSLPETQKYISTVQVDAKNLEVQDA